ncbi:F-box domain-containing protein [Mycena kentingensis (nom. inval.)]|nr:F-box domain-containing protein [Mycena kentingensis (nom. inval.)]
MPFLDLPPELIQRCLHELAITDLARLLSVGNSYLTDLLLSSPTIRYRVQQHIAGVYEPEHMTLTNATTPIADRIKALQETEDRWLAFTPASREALPLPAPWADVQGYTVGEGSYTVMYDMDMETLLGGRASTLSLGSGGTGWKELVTPKAMLDFQLCPASDLFLRITHSTLNDIQRFEVDCRTISTGVVHPLAAKNIVIADIPLVYDLPDLSIEIAGSILAIAFIFHYAPNDAAEQHNRLHVFDWMSGTKLMDPIPINTTAVTFLGPETLLAFDAEENALSAIAIPRRDERETIQQLKFELPNLAPTHRIMPSAAVCGNGLWTPRSPRLPAAKSLQPLQRKLLFDDESSMFVLRYYILRSDVAADDEDGPGIDARIMVVARRSEMLKLFQQHAEPSNPEQNQSPWVLPFATWGPQSSRFLHLSTTFQNPCTSLAGQRLASIDNKAPGQSAPIVIRDFNPGSVRRVRRLLRDSTSASASGSGSEGVELEGAYVHVVEADADAAEDNWDFRSAALQDGGVKSKLAYVEVTSKETFPFHAVHVSDECVVGDGASQGEIEVMRFG